MELDNQELKVVGVDKEKIQVDDYRSGTYKYPFKLSSTPNNLWSKIFNAVYRNTLYSSVQCEAYVQGDCIVVILPEKVDKQHQVDNIKRAVADTNSEYKKVLEKEAREQKRREQLEREREEALRKMRNEANELKF